MSTCVYSTTIIRYSYTDTTISNSENVTHCPQVVYVRGSPGCVGMAGSPGSKEEYPKYIPPKGDFVFVEKPFKSQLSNRLQRFNRWLALLRTNNSRHN